MWHSGFRAGNPSLTFWERNAGMENPSNCKMGCQSHMKREPRMWVRQAATAGKKLSLDVGIFISAGAAQLGNFPSAP